MDNILERNYSRIKILFLMILAITLGSLIGIGGSWLFGESDVEMVYDPELYSLVDHYGEEGFISPNNSVLKVVETGKPVALNELRSLVRESPVILVITEVSCLACMLSLQSWVGAPYENLYSEIQIVRVFVAPSIYHVRNSIPEIENTSLLENPPINLYDEGGHFVENNALVLRPIVLLLKPGLEIAAAGLPSSDPSAADYFVSKIEEIIK